MSNPNYATVRHALVRGKTVPECLSGLDSVCSAGAQCSEVQGSAVASAALTALETTVATAQGTFANKIALAQALMAEIRVLRQDFGAVKAALVTYEAAVAAVAAAST